MPNELSESAMHTYTQTHTNTHMNTRIRAHKHTQTCTQTHTRTHTYVHINTHTYIHTLTVYTEGQAFGTQTKEDCPNSHSSPAPSLPTPSPRFPASNHEAGSVA